MDRILNHFACWLITDAKANIDLSGIAPAQCNKVYIEISVRLIQAFQFFKCLCSRHDAEFVPRYVTCDRNFFDNRAIQVESNKVSLPRECLQRNWIWIGYFTMPTIYSNDMVAWSYCSSNPSATFQISFGLPVNANSRGA